MNVIAITGFFNNKSDSNENGIADWVELRLNNQCRIKNVTSSITSPLCLEGQADYLKLVKINNQSGIAQASCNNSWYANIPLAAEEETNIKISYQNSAAEKELNVTWLPVNIFNKNGDEFVVRKNDSLKITAYDPDNQNGSFTLVYNDQNFNGSNTESKVIKFEKTGLFTISAETVAENGTASSSEITIRVVDYNFGQYEIVQWKNYRRDWIEAKLPIGTFLNIDKKLIGYNSLLKNGLLNSFYSTQSKDCYNIVRIGVDGPILASQKIVPVGVFSSGNTYVTIIDILSDGTRIVKMPIVVDQLRDDIELRLNIFVPGVLFVDGTITKVLTKNDFSESGSYIVKFIYSKECLSSVCHNLRLYQNNIYVGKGK